MFLAQLLSDTKVLGELVRVHRQAPKEWLDLVPRDEAGIVLINFEPDIVEALGAHTRVVREQVRILRGDGIYVLPHAVLVDLHMLRVQAVECFLHEVRQLFLFSFFFLVLLLLSLVNEVEHLDALFVASNDLRFGCLHKVLNAVLNRSLDLEVAVNSQRLLVDLPEAENVRAGRRRNQKTEVSGTIVVGKSMPQQRALGVQLANDRYALVTLRVSIVDLHARVIIDAPVLQFTSLGTNENMGSIELE